MPVYVPVTAEARSTRESRRDHARKQLQRALGPRDVGARVLLAAQQRQVREEVLVVVEGPLDLLELGEVLSRVVADGLEVGDDRLGRAVRAEEDAQLERVLVHGRVHLLEAVAQPLEPEVGQPVERLVGALVLAHEPRGREAVLDELAQHGVELRLRRRPEEPDAPLGLAQQVVAGALAVREQAEHGDLRGRDRRGGRASVLVRGGIVRSELCQCGVSRASGPRTSR